MVEEKIACYTFTVKCGGFVLESPLIIDIGQTFEYWGLKWVVAGAYAENDFYCEQI